jgi:hypothetical protein
VHSENPIVGNARAELPKLNADTFESSSVTMKLHARTGFMTDLP